MIFAHARFQIWNQNQHPFLHNLSDFAYSNPALPGTSNIESTLDYMIAVLYPNTKPAVANQAALPAVGNTINDMRVVTDDGDAKSASYRWEQREGEATPSWHKIADVDWGTDSILQEWQNRTQDLFFMRYGYDDIDAAGAAIVGTFAGQRLYGGKSASTNLTLSANSGDGAGADTGFIQFTDNVRPTVNGTLDFGTTALRWNKGWFDDLQAGTMAIGSGSITDTSNTIAFTGMLITALDVDVGGTLHLTTGQIYDDGGAIDFNANDFDSVATITCDNVVATGGPASQFASGTNIGDITFTNGNIASASATVSFNALNLTTTGIGTFGRLDADNLRLDANTLSVTNANGSLTLAANGSGSIASSFPFALTGAWTVTGANASVVNGTFTASGTGAYIQADNLRLDGNTLSTQDANGDLLLSPNGTGLVGLTAGAYPVTDSVYDLGKTGNVWNKLWLDGSIGGATEITVADLLTLRSVTYRDSARTLPAQAGDSVFYDGAQWLASVPDSEITHSSLTGLTTGDAGHTQFALLAGRSGGQSLIGGTAASENLNFESTAHATKGFIQVKDTVRTFTDASYSGSWSGADLGDSSHRFRHVYTAGEFFGFRAENVAVLPSSSAANAGRLVFYTADSNLYMDTGLAITQVGFQRTVTDTVWDGVTTLKNVTVSGPDARTVSWSLQDNTNDFENMYVSIKATSSTNVRITVGTALTAGSYRLIGS